MKASIFLFEAFIRCIDASRERAAEAITSFGPALSFLVVIEDVKEEK